MDLGTCGGEPGTDLSLALKHGEYLCGYSWVCTQIYISSVAKPFLCVPLACTLSKADLPIELIELLEKIIIQ